MGEGIDEGIGRMRRYERGIEMVFLKMESGELFMNIPARHQDTTISYKTFPDISYYPQ
jgi:hypothetical protein